MKRLIKYLSHIFTPQPLNHSITQPINPIFRPWHWGALLILFLVHVGYFSWWMGTDTRPPAWDESHHLRIALEYKEELGAGRWGRLLRPVFSNYPPLYHLSLALFFTLVRHPRPFPPENRGPRRVGQPFLSLSSRSVLVFSGSKALFTGGGFGGRCRGVLFPGHFGTPAPSHD